MIAERKRAGMRLPPRSKSPIKTFLKSPARRNPSLGPGSSPIRGSIAAPRAASTAAPVRRRLDFSNASFEETQDTSEIHEAPQKRGGSAMPSISTTKLTDGQRLQPRMEVTSSDPGDSIQEDIAMLGDEDSFQLVDTGGDEDMDIPDEEPEEEREQSPELLEENPPTKKGKGKAKAVEMAKVAVVKQPAGKRGRPKRQNPPDIEENEEEEPESPLAEVVEPVKKTGGRPKKTTPQEEEEEEEEQPENLTPEAVEPVKKKGGRPKKAAPQEEQAPSPAALSPQIQKPIKKQGGRSKRPAAVEEEPEEDLRPAKRSRRSLDGPVATKSKTKSKDAAAAAPAAKEPKVKGRKPKLAAIAEDSPIVQRGPPIPRNNSGLMIIRRETPLDGSAFKQTRSGRNSIKPLSYWRNEKIEYTTDKTEDHFSRNKNLLMPTIKEVVRIEEAEQPKRVRGKSRAPRSKKRAESESEDEAELEPWELEPGFINGDIRVWDPVDQLGSQSEETQADIAFSAAALVTTPIAHATFRFAKTLTLPFFGSGMVDLPPGGVKKQKNSRKMQMVFFVYRGRVQVTVNDTAFRIGQGGMWQVPRGTLCVPRPFSSN